MHTMQDTKKLMIRMKTPNPSKTRGFTLVEIMVCLLIICAVASWVGFKMVRFVREQEFEHGITSLFTSLRSAQIVAMASGADIRVDLDKVDEKATCIFHAFEPALEAMEGRKIVLGNEVEFSWNEKKTPKKQLVIYSSGRIEPLGVLGFHFGEDKETRKSFLDLRQPLLIKVLEEYPKK